MAYDPDSRPVVQGVEAGPNAKIIIAKETGDIHFGPDTSETSLRHPKPTPIKWRYLLSIGTAVVVAVAFFSGLTPPTDNPFRSILHDPAAGSTILHTLFREDPPTYPPLRRSGLSFSPGTTCATTFTSITRSLPPTEDGAPNMFSCPRTGHRIATISTSWC